MFGSLFRRGDRTQAPPPAPILAGMAPVEAGPERPPHPVLARMLSEVSAIDTAIGFHRQLMDRVRAPLADAPNEAMATIVCDALVRLPAARFDGGAGRVQWETWALRMAIEHCSAPGVVLVFSAPQMVAICRAIGDLFGQDWQRNNYAWPGYASGLLCTTLDAARCPRTPEVDRALASLLQRVGTAQPVLAHRMKVATAVVAYLGLPRTASPTLASIDADFARREAMRARIAAIAGPDLSPLLDVLFDVQPLNSSKAAEFAKLPEVAGFLGRPPAVLGAALTALFRITREFPKPDYEYWAWISRRFGGFPVGVAHPGYIERSFLDLTLLILRRRIEIADAAMADLVRQAVTAMRLPSPWRSRHFLNQAIKIATGADGAQTRAALLWLAGRVALLGQLNIPDDWTQPIQQAVGNAAPDAALAVPELDLTMAGSPSVTR